MDEPLSLPCDCGGHDAACAHCDGSGSIDVVGCPLAQVSDDVWDALELAELAEAGTWPVAGGTLDQTTSFTEAFGLIRGETSQWKRKHGIKD